MPKVLLGFMGAGKSTIASIMSDDYIDIDKAIETEIGMSIAEFFTQSGETVFRQIESQVLENLLHLPDKQVIASGGGVVTSVKNRELLLKNKDNNIFLDASFDVIYQRISEDKENQRPLFINHSKEEFYEIFSQRKRLYAELAGQVISVDGLQPNEIVRKIR